jgi:membrane associated rhomboid family serine protease
MAFNRYSGGFQNSTPAVINLIIINVIVFVAQITFGGLQGESRVTDLFALHHYKADVFGVQQIITHMFMHGGFLHLFFNMFALYVFGANIERMWGAKRFLIFYFICGIGAAIVQLASYAYDYRALDKMVMNYEQVIQYQEILRMNATVGASGAIMGVVAAFGYLFQNTEMMIIPIPIPIKAKWAVLGIIAIDVFSGIAGRPGDNVAHFAHIGGALTGFLIVYFQSRHERRRY